MARLGKKVIIVPKEVKVNISSNKICVEGKNGKLEQAMPSGISVEAKDDQLFVKITSETKTSKSLQGTIRAIIINMIKGVTEGYVKQLEIVGVGYRAQKQQDKLNLQLGFSHPVVYSSPEGVEIETPKPNQIVVKGIDKVKVGQAAAEIRAIFPPEPYKGKGIRYTNEYVRKKVGKAITK